MSTEPKPDQEPKREAHPTSHPEPTTPVPPPTPRRKNGAKVIEPFDYKAHVAALVARAPQLDDLPLQHQQTLARIFRPVALTASVERRSA